MPDHAAVTTPHPAYLAAKRVRKLNNFSGEPERYLDAAHDNAAAWTIVVYDDDRCCAIVVYEDKPDTVASLGWDAGRWVKG